MKIQLTEREIWYLSIFYKKRHNINVGDGPPGLSILKNPIKHDIDAISVSLELIVKDLNNYSRKGNGKFN